MRPVLRDGQWFNLPCGCVDDCCCQVECAVTLPGPVAYVCEVTVGGVVVPPSAYRLLENQLIRIDGGCWPDCQALELPPGAPGTFTVTYMRGREVPPGGRAAVAALANEIWKACQDGPGGKGCRLPSNVTEIVRQGVTYDMTREKGMEMIGALPEVASWVNMVNPRGQRTPSGVWSPDLPKHRSETGGPWW